MPGRVHATVKLACIPVCAVRVVLGILCVAHKLAPNALVLWSHFGKNCYTCRGSYCYAVRLPHKIYRRYTSLQILVRCS